MEVRNGLPAMHPGVDHKPVTVFRNPLLRGQCLRHYEHVPDQRFITGLQLVYRGDMPVGNDQDMGTRNRVDIAKGRDLLISVDDRGSCFAGKDFTKYTGHTDQQ